MFFPLFLKTSGVKFLIVGAGNVALAKLESILDFSKPSQITLLSKDFTSQNKEIINSAKVDLINDSYKKDYLVNFDVIIAATNFKDINALIAKDARDLGKLVNAVDDVDNSDFIFGSNIKRDNITVAINTSGTAPVLARHLKNELLLNIPSNIGLLSEFLQKNKSLLREKISNIQARRLFLQEVIDSEIALEVLAHNFNKAQNILESKLANYSDNKRAAVYFIGAGPGDPDLITLKAIKYLAKADVVLYDRLVAPDILKYARKDALKINVGKKRGAHSHSQDEINQMIRKYALEGNIVARLKGGDATLFARLGEEIESISDLKIPYQIIPGVTAASGAAAYAGIPLTSRDSNKSVRFLTLYKSNSEEADYFKELAQSNDSLVLYMSSHNLLEIAQRLVDAGKNATTPIAVIEQATTDFQKVFVSEIGKVKVDFAGKEFISPSLVIIGEIVKGHNKYKWREENLSGEYFT